LKRFATAKECSAEQGLAGTWETQGRGGSALDAEAFEFNAQILGIFSFLAMHKMQ